MEAETAAPGAEATQPPVVVVMGVSGSGKSVVGMALARALGGRLAEGDKFHPSENIARMSSGMPLRDQDRWGWLDAIVAEIGHADAEHGPLVVACSALKRAYRDRLRRADPNILFVYLEVPRDVAAVRVASRKGHFMPASLIDSQFGDLEPPLADERAIWLDATGDIGGLVAAVVASLAASDGLAAARL